MFKNPSPFPNWGGVQHNIILNHNFATTQKPLPKIKKSGTNGSHVVIIMDESGSMGPHQDETISGVNSFIKDQAAAGPGKVTVSTFSGNKVTTIRNTDLLECAAITTEDYQPNSMTNLYDAIGTVVNEVNTAMPSKKKERPAVVVMIMTDGHENSSQKYSSENIKALVKECEKNEWSFMFLGANIDSFAVGNSIGMNQSNTASYSMGNLEGTIAVASSVTTRLRSAKLAGADNASLYATSYFTGAERSTMGGDDNA